MEKKRDYYFDNAKFFLVLLVVLGHAMEIPKGNNISAFYQLIYLFHMPAFTLVSGYFVKFQKKQKLAELILQYAVFQTIYCLFDIYILKNDGTFTYTTPYWILWFSLALIVWKVITPYIARFKFSLVLSILVAILTGYDNSIEYYLSLSRIIVLFPFFLLGYYAEKSHFEKLRSFLPPALSLSLFAISFQILLKRQPFPTGLFYHAIPYQNMEMSGWGAGVSRLLVLLWGSILLCCFLAVIPNEKKRYSQFGQRTLQAYLLHGFIIKLLIRYQVNTLLTSALHKALFFVCMILLTILLLSKSLQYIFRPIASLTNLLSPMKKADAQPCLTQE